MLDFIRKNPNQFLFDFDIEGTLKYVRYYEDNYIVELDSGEIIVISAEKVRDWYDE